MKTVVHGSYSQLSSVYAKQIEWAEKEGYENCNALYEVYVTSPSEVLQESDFITEVYYPVKKIWYYVKKKCQLNRNFFYLTSTFEKC